MKLTDVDLIVITGAGSGIGRAVALRFAARGAHVVVADINKDSADATAELITAAGGTAVARRLDVADADDFEEFARWVHDEHGVPGVVVNNAGIGAMAPVVDTSESDWDRIIGINLLGVVTGARIFAQQMVDAGKPGQIVNVASAAAFAPLPNLASYSATKYAVKMLSDCIRAELAPAGIGVSVICPGIVKTNLFVTAQHPGVTAEEAAHRTHIAGASTDRLRAFHIISGPDVVARAVDRAVRYNLRTVLVRPEAYLVYALRRVSPSALRGGTNLVFGVRTVQLGLRLSRNPLVARIIGKETSPIPATTPTAVGNATR